MCIHYFRDEVQANRITPIHVLNLYQRADGYTKGLDKTTFLKWVALAYKLSRLYT